VERICSSRCTCQEIDIIPGEQCEWGQPVAVCMNILRHSYHPTPPLNGEWKKQEADESHQLTVLLACLLILSKQVGPKLFGGARVGMSTLL
jgi:hypothetical protein